MPLFPVPHNDPTSGLSPRKLARVQRAHEDAELDLFHYSVQVRLRAECDRVDSEAIADAARAALREELSFLSEGLARAGNSQAALELVARKLDFLGNGNNRRLTRRFGA